MLKLLMRPVMVGHFDKSSNDVTFQRNCFYILVIWFSFTLSGTAFFKFSVTFKVKNTISFCPHAYSGNIRGV